MILLPLLALVQDRPAAPAAPPPYYQPSQATVVAEPLAIFIAAADGGDARTTRAELRKRLIEATSADPPWMNGIGYIAYSDWAERWLGDRNGLPSPFELDRDGDNKVTVDDLLDRFDAIFTRLDKDRDDVLTRAELLTIRTPTLDPRGRRRRDEPPAQPRD